MNVIMSSPTQNSNAPSFLGLAKSLDKKDKETKETVASISSEYNKKLSSLLYLQKYLKTLEQVENDVLTIQKGFLSTTWANSEDKNSFNRRLQQMDAEYITVTPI